MASTDSLRASSDERRRLDALAGYRVLDTPAERAFDRITSLAAHVFDVPIALVSLVDEHRQWFKSRVGLEMSETARDVSFCTHAVAQGRTLIVPDALNDPRFQANPLVLGDPNIRFYAGAPLCTPEGLALGTLCLIDRRPRTLSQELTARLEAMAALVMDLLDFQRGMWEAMERETAEKRQLEAYRTFFDNAPIGLCHMKVDGTVLGWNAAMERMLGFTAAEAMGRFLPHVPAEQRFEYEAAAADLVASKVAARGLRRERRRKDGSFVMVEFSVSPMFDSNGEVVELLSAIEDITERERAAARVARSEASFRGLIEHSPIAMGVHREDRFLFANSALVRLLQLGSAAEIVGREVHDFADPDDIADGRLRLAQAKSSGVGPFDARLRQADGTWVIVEASMVPIIFDGLPAILSIGHDVTEARRMQEETLRRERDLARLDTLTRLLNRRGCEEVYRREAARADRHREPLSLLLIDLDGFKNINDTLGHEAGDRVLVAVADILRQMARGEDLAVRWGGDELLALLPSTGLDGARRFAERFRRSVESQLETLHAMPITVSVGTSERRGSESLDVIVARADERLYEAKIAGRNCVR